MGPASWQEGFGTAQQNPTAAAPSSSFAGNDFEANKFYGEEGDEEPMGVGGLSALLGVARSRPEQEVGQNPPSRQSQHQPPSQARPGSSGAPPPAAPVDNNGSDSLSRSDLMRMICGDSFGGEEDSAATDTANNGSDGNKRRKVEAPPDPPAKMPSALPPANGRGTSNNGSDKGAEKSNGLFSVSLPSDDSDSDDSD